MSGRDDEKKKIIVDLLQQEEREKRELLMLFAEKEEEGVKFNRRFNMDSDLQEMRFWYYKLTRDRTKDEISDYLKKGYKLNKDVDLKTSPHHVLTTELFRLKELQAKCQLMSLAFIGIGLVVKTLGDPTRQKKITCMQCNTENIVSCTGAPVQGIDKTCLKCEKEHAQVYQPQCGHVCLCKSCFEKEKNEIHENETLKDVFK